MAPATSVQMAQSVPINILTPASQAAGTVLSAAVDLLDYEGLMEFQQNLGTITGSITGSISVNELVESDTSGGRYTEFQMADLILRHGESFAKTTGATIV